jgi:hypothetical protein
MNVFLCAVVNVPTANEPFASQQSAASLFSAGKIVYLCICFFVSILKDSFNLSSEGGLHDRDNRSEIFLLALLELIPIHFNRLLKWFLIDNTLKISHAIVVIASPMTANQRPSVEYTNPKTARAAVVVTQDTLFSAVLFLCRSIICGMSRNPNIKPIPKMVTSCHIFLTACAGLPRLHAAASRRVD